MNLGAGLFLLLTNGRQPDAYCAFNPQLARKYDLLIIEDDPYYFLQFQKVSSSDLSLCLYCVID